MANLEGATVGNYLIQERLGVGGMGEVYRARHQKLPWQVCVKIIRPDRSDAEGMAYFATLFEREAQVLATLNHPHIVQLRDYGARPEDGLAYLVMEYVDGGDLAAMLRRAGGPLPLDQVVNVVEQIAAGLDYAHGKHILHRDLKPQNILHYGDGRLVIADFGLAKAVETAMTTSRMQQTVSAGTPAYMAPEHIQEAPEFRSDLYALGVMTYEMLAGRVPFQGNATQMMFAHLQKAPPSLQALNPGIAPDLEAVVLKMLAKDPNDRYQSAAAFVQALREAIEQGTIPDRRGREHWVLPPTEHEPTVPVEALPTRYLSPAPEAPPASGATPHLDARPPVPGERPSGVTAPVSPTAPTAPSGKAYWQRPWVWGSTVLVVGVVLVLITRFPLRPTATAPTAVPTTTTTQTEPTTVPVPSVASTAVPTFIILSGHTNYVRSVAFSPDGRTLASGSEDKTIKLWDVASGKVLRTLSGHSESVYSVAFSPDGRTLASGSGDNTIKLWDVASGKVLYTLSGHSDTVLSVAFSPAGTSRAPENGSAPPNYILASGSFDQTIRLWDVASGQALRTLSGHTNSVLSVAFSPDGRTLASGSEDKTIKLWDVASGKVLRTLSGHTNFVNSVTFSPAGTSVQPQGGSGKLGSPTAPENGSAPPNYILASGSADKTIKLWDVASGKVLHTLSGHSDAVLSVAFSPAGTSVQPQGGSGKLGSPTAPENGSAPPNYTLASGSDDQTIKLWDVASGRELLTLSGHSDSVALVAFSPDGRTLASGSGDQTIRLWKV